MCFLDHVYSRNIRKPDIGAVNHSRNKLVLLFTTNSIKNISSRIADIICYLKKRVGE